MRILLVHQNFPGQFLRLAPELKKRGHDVLALTSEHNKRPSPVPVARYRAPTPPEHPVPPLVRTYSETADRGASAARAAEQLRLKHDFTPDVIFGHCGWGETLFLSEVWPEARMLSYAEFMYRSRGLDTDFDPEFRRDHLGSRIAVNTRAAHMIQAMVRADAALSPTAWQASTFPDLLRDKISVIHDGVDTEKVRPDPEARLELPGGRVLTAGDEVLSFVNRNLEPYRGFHVFMRALPEVMAARPDAQVVIIGDTGQSYGAAPPGGGERTWKQVMLDEVGDRLDLARVHFTGRVPYSQFLALMQVTRVHAYLTYPFVLSWSMLEAMSAGALVVGSRTPPVEEVIEDGVNGRIVDFFDIPGWSRVLTEALADPGAALEMRQNARQTIVDRYDLRTVCLPALIDFVESGGA